MTPPRIKIVLDNPSRAFHPREVLWGQFSVEGVAPHDLRSVELSVLWHTEGKGEEDMSIHFFEQFNPQSGQAFDGPQPHRFSTVLPNSPLTYSGFIVKISWCVRVRAFLSRGKELSLEVPFRLGDVPHPQPVAT
jgi:hypothetical protein